MSLDNDYERFAYDVVKFIIDRGGYKATDELCKSVSAMLLRGPMFTTWPRDAAEANQRARDRAAVRPVHPMPTLPRLPSLPRPVLPRVLPPLIRK